MREEYQDQVKTENRNPNEYDVTFSIKKKYRITAQDKEEAIELAWQYFDDLLRYDKGEFNIKVIKIGSLDFR